MAAIYRSFLMDENPVIQNEQDDEISLIDLFAVLLKHKFLIIGITGAAMILAVVISIISLKTLFLKISDWVTERYPSNARIILTQQFFAAHMQS